MSWWSWQLSPPRRAPQRTLSPPWSSGILVANPLPADQQLDPAVHDAALAQALAEAEGLSGKEVTPFLLQRIVEITGGASLEVNLEIAANNIRVAAEIATAWAARP